MAQIQVHKIIDADGNLDTVDDQTAGEGWEFDLELADGTIVDAFPVTDADGFGGWTFTFGPGGTSATVAEFEHLGEPDDPVFQEFELLDASCYEIQLDPANEILVGELEGSSVSFPVEDQTNYSCRFFNAPTPFSGGIVELFKYIDADGDLDTTDDRTEGEGWEFDLELADGTVLPLIPVTDDIGFAQWEFDVGPDGTTATVTELPQKGFELLDAFCSGIAFPGDDVDLGDFVGSLDGDSVSFHVGDPIEEYQCEFYNASSGQNSVGGETATPPSNTLPPTDTGGSTSTTTSDSWRVMLVVLAGILAAALVSMPIGRTSRTASRRR